jgi:hypothetical protein
MENSAWNSEFGIQISEDNRFPFLWCTGNALKYIRSSEFWIQAWVTRK